jgi:hypothetical protein
VILRSFGKTPGGGGGGRQRQPQAAAVAAESSPLKIHVACRTTLSILTVAEGTAPGQRRPAPARIWAQPSWRC